MSPTRVSFDLLSDIHPSPRSSPAAARLLPSSPEQLRKLMKRALTPRQYLFMCDYYFAQRTIYETAVLRGVTAPTVSRTLKRARERLKKYLSLLPLFLPPPSQ